MVADPSQLIIAKLVAVCYDKLLINNVDRGRYVECMIALSLGDGWSLTSEVWDWSPWDIAGPCGARIEIKQSARLQTWSLGLGAPRPRPPSFDIAVRKARWTKGGDHPCYVPGRPADIYVFAWHPVRDPETADHRDPGQWRFFVVPEERLPREKKTLSLNLLKDLSEEIGNEQLASDVAAKLPVPSMLKCRREADNGLFMRPSRFDSQLPKSESYANTA